MSTTQSNAAPLSLAERARLLADEKKIPLGEAQSIVWQEQTRELARRLTQRTAPQRETLAQQAIRIARAKGVLLGDAQRQVYAQPTVGPTPGDEDAVQRLARVAECSHDEARAMLAAQRSAGGPATPGAFAQTPPATRTQPTGTQPAPAKPGVTLPSNQDNPTQMAQLLVPTFRGLRPTTSGAMARALAQNTGLDRDDLLKDIARNTSGGRLDLDGLADAVLRRCPGCLRSTVDAAVSGAALVATGSAK